MQYTYWSTSQEVKTITRSNFVSWERHFLKNHIQNVMEKLFPDLFLKNQNWAYVLINSVKFYTVYFYCISNWGPLKYTEPKLQNTCIYVTFFCESKERSETSHPVSFYAWLFKKNISLVIFYCRTNFHCLVAFTSWDIGQYVYCNCLLTRLWRHKIWK